MNNIGITGHTKGIGLELNNTLKESGHIIYGYSRSNDYDLSHSITIDRIVFSVNENQIDTFVINAEYDHSQLKLLYALDRLWEKDRDKTIVVISSISGTYPNRFVPHEYSIQKLALDKAVEQLQINRPYRLINIRPGYVDTAATNHVTSPKMSVSDVANVITWSLTAPLHILVRNITFTPR